jgi:hypothetical protein
MSTTFNFYTSPDSKIGEIYYPVRTSILISATDGIDVSGFDTLDGDIISVCAIDNYTLSADIDVRVYGDFVVSATNLLGVTTSASDTGYVYYNHSNYISDDDTKKFDLRKLLPLHLDSSELGDFVEMFQNYLNEMYYARIQERNNPELVSNPQMISMLEKIKQISTLHDPAEIDITYIQQLASYLGYDIDVTMSRDSINDINTDSGIDNTYRVDNEITRRYLRNVIENLPNWYKIKTTRNAIKVLLYSFGLIGDIVYNWTDSNVSAGGYGNDRSKWYINDESLSYVDSVIGVPYNYFPTPHFSIKISQNELQSKWVNNLSELLIAIESIRPINNVLDEIILILYEEVQSKVVVIEYDIPMIRTSATTSTDPEIYSPSSDYFTIPDSESVDITWSLGFEEV